MLNFYFALKCVVACQNGQKCLQRNNDGEDLHSILLRISNKNKQQEQQNRGSGITPLSELHSVVPRWLLGKEMGIVNSQIGTRL